MGSNAQLMAGDHLVTDDFWNIAKDAGEGTLMTFTYDARKFDAARTVLAKFEAADYSAEGFTLYAYAAVQAWVQAAEATGGTDSHRIASWLRAGNRIRTVTGEVSFDRAGDLRDPKFALVVRKEKKRKEKKRKEKKRKEKKGKERNVWCRVQYR